MAMYIYQNSWSSVLFSWTIIILYTVFSCNSLDIKFFFFFVWGGRGVSAGHPCSTHVLPRLLRYAAKRAVRIMPWGGSMLDETGFYAPSVAHNALPSRPWLDISGFHGHNSTASKLLRYSRPRERGMPTRTLWLTPLTLWLVLIFIISASYYKRHRKLLYRSYCIITVLFSNN